MCYSVHFTRFVYRYVRHAGNDPGQKNQQNPQNRGQKVASYGQSSARANAWRYPLTPSPLHNALNAAAKRLEGTLTAPARTTEQLPQQQDFLTGPQALQTSRPVWKSEFMLAGFTRPQIALIEQTFAETDQFLFENG